VIVVSNALHYVYT